MEVLVKSIAYNKILVGSISPEQLNTTADPTYIMYDDKYVQILSIVNYPDGLPKAWLSNIAQIPNVNITIKYEPTTEKERDDIFDQLYQSVDREKEKTVDAELVTKQIEQAQKMSAESKLNNRQAYFFTVLIMVSGETVPQLKDNVAHVKKKLARYGISRLVSLQESALKMVLPLGYSDQKINAITNNFITTLGIAKSYPYNSTHLIDPKGIIIGRTLDGALVKLDQYVHLNENNSYRTNANTLIIGSSGQGKSVATKTLLLGLLRQKYRVMVLDPEREYKKLADEFGERINLAGGKALINPFEIRRMSNDFDINSFEAHIKFLKTVFAIYAPSLSDFDIAKIGELLVETYNEFGINRETDISTLKPTDYFIAKDFLKYIESKLNNAKTYEIERLENIRLIVYEMAVGANASLLNGYTNINLNSNFIVFDTQDLKTSDESIKRLQYYMLMRYAYEQIILTKGRSVMIVEEAHTFMDPKHPEMALSLVDYAKRARKYLSSIFLVTQSPMDMLREGLESITVELLTNVTYQIILGLDGDAASKVQQLNALTDSERKLLEKKMQGVGILKIGSSKVAIKIEYPEFLRNYEK